MSPAAVASVNEASSSFAEVYRVTRLMEDARAFDDAVSGRMYGGSMICESRRYLVEKFCGGK